MTCCENSATLTWNKTNKGLGFACRFMSCAWTGIKVSEFVYRGFFVWTLVLAGALLKGVYCVLLVFCVKVNCVIRILSGLILKQKKTYHIFSKFYED